MRRTFSLGAGEHLSSRLPGQGAQELFLIFSFLLLPSFGSQASIAHILAGDRQITGVTTESSFRKPYIDQGEHITNNPGDWYKKQLLHFRYPEQKELFLTDLTGITHHMIFKNDGDGLTFDGLYYRLYNKTLDCFVTIQTFRGAEQGVLLDVRTQTFIPITSRDQSLSYDAVATLVSGFTAGKNYVAAPKPGSKEAKSGFVRVK